jgi:membrane protein insertase Oxa1/YidC/SpoIIIJ
LPWIFSDWLQNLAAPDMMIPWEWLPVIADPSTATGFFGFLYLGPYFNLLPILAAGLMLLVQRLMMPPATTEQEEAQRAMMKYMPIIMAVLFFKVAAGLCLYFIVSSIWGLVERKLLLPKKHPDLPDTAAAPVEEKKVEAKPSIWAMALERVNEATKARETPPAAAPTSSASMAEGPPPPISGGKKNRKQRKKDKQKKAKQGGGSPPPPTSNGADGRGLVDKVRDWIKDVLKNAEKK